MLFNLKQDISNSRLKNAIRRELLTGEKARGGVAARHDEFKVAGCCYCYFLCCLDYCYAARAVADCHAAER